MELLQLLGRKASMFVLTLAALVIVGLADKQAAEAIGWCIVGALGIFCGANSVVTVGTSKKKKDEEE
jgi:hypothetical protein